MLRPIIAENHYAALGRMMNPASSLVLKYNISIQTGKEVRKREYQKKKTTI